MHLQIDKAHINWAGSHAGIFQPRSPVGWYRAMRKSFTCSKPLSWDLAQYTNSIQRQNTILTSPLSEILRLTRTYAQEAHRAFRRRRPSTRLRTRSAIHTPAAYSQRRSGSGSEQHPRFLADSGIRGGSYGKELADFMGCVTVC